MMIVYFSIGVVDPEDDQNGIQFLKSAIATIRSYTISKGVDYVIYETKPQTFYAKCKTYRRGCNWIIRANVIQKKGCWEIRRYNGRHTITQLDSNTVAKAMKPLVESDPSIKLPKRLVEKVEVNSQSFQYMERILPNFAIVVLDNGSKDA
ncbi:hypothetical protein Ahy_A01g004844 [Arachis hypogaea]|uniref:Uncharacterized protein n=1 Tax=Arachis hypogaea TaxID=3818 RepID=A0A445EXA9_ARAHY|nr:hypothetical protein Ahy_A01g004844 [Arachis hypogaea]